MSIFIWLIMNSPYQVQTYLCMPFDVQFNIWGTNWQRCRKSQINFYRWHLQETEFRNTGCWDIIALDKIATHIIAVPGCCCLFCFYSVELNWTLILPEGQHLKVCCDLPFILNPFCMVPIWYIGVLLLWKYSFFQQCFLVECPFPSLFQSFSQDKRSQHDV